MCTTTFDRRTSESWIGGGNSIAYAYDKASNLLSATDAFSGLAMTYDARDRVRTVDNAGTPGVPNVVLTYNYDPASNLLSTADTIAGAVGGLNSYTYDGLDRVTRITQSGLNVTDKRVDLAYNPLGQFSSLQRFHDLAGTQLVVGSTYTYDTLNRLTGLHHRNAANTDVSFFDFVYDTHSRITRITDIDGATDYTYDSRDQLIAANRADPTNSDETYTYDANATASLPAATETATSPARTTVCSRTARSTMSTTPKATSRAAPRSPPAYSANSPGTTAIA